MKNKHETYPSYIETKTDKDIIVPIYNNYPQILAMIKLEKETSQNVCEIMKYIFSKYTGYFIRTHESIYGTAGIPDYQGVIEINSFRIDFAIELKKRNGKIRKSQKKVMKYLKTQGCLVAVCYTVQDVIDFFKKEIGIKI